MDNVSEEAFALAFVDVLRTSLARSGDVAVPGLGTFRVEHVPSSFVETEDGETALTPPRDEVVFEAGPLLTARRDV